MIHLILQILGAAFAMFWDVLWPLVLGFLLSAIVQSVVSRDHMVLLLGDDSVKSITFATLFGMASSSCSYAAVALARSIFNKGASFTAAMVFELASTNLVIELGIILIVFLGWQFTLAEFIGGIFMIVAITIIFHFFLKKMLVAQARKESAKGIVGRMEGHAAMDMSAAGNSVFQKIFSSDGFRAISHFFVMDWYSVWTDIALGFLIAGALSVLVPDTFWQVFFLKSNPSLAFIEGPLVGPLVAVVSFVCSVGNVPLAAVLWHGGISFGGVVSFIFADLIIVPILNIYKKYYGRRMLFFLSAAFYLCMAFAGYMVAIIFHLLHLTPSDRSIRFITTGIQWNYTTWLNIVFLILAGVLIVTFLKTGGVHMLSMMDAGAEDHMEG